MLDTEQLHADQVAYWNGPGGTSWTARQVHTDAMLAPITEALIAEAAPQPGERVLDIGCGCGATTLALARRVGREGHVTGLDVSAPMLAVAQARGAGVANIDWVRADAATHRFAPAGFDLLISRFGVMFFGDPPAAFANLRRALRPGGRLVFVCWRGIGENPWMQVPLHAAYAHVPRLPKPEPGAPGPFAFADPARITGILVEAGWPAPTIAPLDQLIDIAAGGGLEAAVVQATCMGAAARAMQDQPEAARAAATDAIRAALAPYARGPRVALPGAMWLVTAIL